MSIARVTLYTCPSCGDSHEDADDARACCDPSEVTGYLWGTCGSIKLDEDEARECCFDGDGATRWKCESCESYYDDAETAADCCGLGPVTIARLPAIDRTRRPSDLLSERACLLPTSFWGGFRS